MNKRFLSLLIGISFGFIVDAQDIEVKKFESLEKDQMAALSPRKDVNGNDCALVLVNTLKREWNLRAWSLVMSSIKMMHIMSIWRMVPSISK